MSKMPCALVKMIKKLDEMQVSIYNQKNEIMKMEKEYKKINKLATSLVGGIDKAKTKAPRKPSGFELPVCISNNLCEFLSLPQGSRVSRTEVTKFIIHYISDNNLIHPERKIQVVPDDKLANLLNVPLDELNNLTRFTIQKYMNQHFLGKSSL